MEYISLLGIVLGMVVFIGMMFKGFHVAISGICAALVLALTSGSDPIEIMTGTWASGFAGYMQSMFLVFLFGALFGRLLNDCGGSKRIAIALYRFFSSRKHGDQRFYAVCFLIAMYAILIYAGVSGMIVVFAVYNIAYELFRRLDVPWNMYGYGGVSGVAIFWVAGSLQVANVSAADVCGVTTMAAPVMSIVATVVFYLVLLVIVKWDLIHYDKRSMGFFPMGQRIYEERGEDPNAALDDTTGLPGLVPSVLPIVIMVVMAGMGVNVAFAMFVGCIIISAIMFKRYTNFKDTLTQGIVSCFGPSCGVSVTSAMATVIKVVPGFAIITDLLTVFPPLIQGVLIISLVTFCASSSGAAIQSMGPEVLQLFGAAGLGPAASARLMTIAAFTGCPPHSAGIANVCALCRIDYKDALYVYFKGSMIPGFCALVSAIVLIRLGIMF